MCTAGGCKDAETLNGSKHLRTGTGAIRRELLINSHLSAPQAQCEKHFACPVLRHFEPFRVSRAFANARRTHRPPAPDCFLNLKPEDYFLFLVLYIHSKGIDCVLVLNVNCSDGLCYFVILFSRCQRKYTSSCVTSCFYVWFG